MQDGTRAIETTGVVDEKGTLHLDEPLPEAASRSVRVILLFESDDDIEEQAWLRAASRSAAFAFLDEPEEDIYTAEDGEPFTEEA
jgi:hypothetical protein